MYLDLTAVMGDMEMGKRAKQLLDEICHVVVLAHFSECELQQHASVRRAHCSEIHHR